MPAVIDCSSTNIADNGDVFIVRDPQLRLSELERVQTKWRTFLHASDSK